jgi:outer membrane protein
LDQAVHLALEHQPAVLSARALTDAAAGRVEQARAAYLPQITGSAVYQRVHGTSSSRPLTTTTPTIAGTATVGAVTTRPSTYDLYSAGLSATQLIWDFGQTIQRTRAASATREAQQAAEHTARIQAALAVRRAFFQAQAQKALIRVGQETVKNQERHLQQIQGFVTQGIRPQIDLAQARADLANSRLTLITASTGFATARAQLNQAMGLTAPSNYDVADEELAEVPGENEPLDRLLRTAVASRPELVTLERQRRAAELTLSAIRGAYGPALTALGGVSESGLALDELGTNWNVGVNLSWPIFQGGLTHGQVREASANLRAAALQITAQELSVRVEVEQASLGIQAAKTGLDAATEALTNARERLRLAEGRYESGVGSIIELSDAELAFASAAAQLVQSQFNLATARADLLAALGK